MLRKQLTSCFLVLALLLTMIPSVFAAEPSASPEKLGSPTVWSYPDSENFDRTSDTAVVDTFTTKRAATEAQGFKVTFACDEHITVDVFDTQDYTSPSGTSVTAAYARDSETGEIDTSGDGQVNFRVNAEDGYEIVSVSADKNYKNLKDSSDTKVEGIKETMIYCNAPSGATAPHLLKPGITDERI